MKYSLFIDLDGVLCDFDGAVRALFGREPHELKPGEMWSRIARTPGFYEHLAWLPDGRELWKHVAPYSPTVLTGLPRGSWAEPQKRAWCRRELGADVPVITCMSREKAERAREAAPEGTTLVLVDDRQSVGERWEAAGNIFILHRSARESIAALSALGFR